MIPVYGLQKTTLLDYSGHLASTIFLGHCSMRCPFCQNSTLIGNEITDPLIPKEEVLSHLRKRKHLLEGVCITGGEPTLYKGLPEFIQSIKSLGYLVKLDTNGTNPDMVRLLVDEGLIDYVAMDIKNCKEHYARTAGIHNLDLSYIEKSVSLLKENAVAHEFRTTVVKEYHTVQDLQKIGMWLHGDSPYYIQNFEDSEHVLQKGLHGFSNEELAMLKDAVLPYLPNAKVRGEFSS